MVTKVFRWRYNLITTEKMFSYCKGKEYPRQSVNDDLDLLFEAIQLGKKPDDVVATYFLPMLTENELNLVERKDIHYLQTFASINPDVNEAEMKLSKSNLKFVYSRGGRKTFTIELEERSQNSLLLPVSPPELPPVQNHTDKSSKNQHHRLSKLKTPNCCSLQ